MTQYSSPRLDFWLPDHFQNLPLPFKYTLGGPSETFPFSFSRYTYDSTVKFVHGSTPFFGGRSTFWSAWSPTPTPDLMRKWPESMKKTAGKPDSKFFDRARSLLRVTSASDIGPPYAKLQDEVDERVQQAVAGKNIPTVTDAFPAPMAVGAVAQSTTIRFTKFSTPCSARPLRTAATASERWDGVRTSLGDGKASSIPRDRAWLSSSASECRQGPQREICSFCWYSGSPCMTGHEAHSLHRSISQRNASPQQLPKISCADNPGRWEDGDGPFPFSCRWSHPQIGI